MLHSNQPQVITVHIRGTITGLNVSLAPIEVIFRNETLSKTVVSNTEGFYEVDLPLGDYLMTAQQGPPGSRKWHERPLFRVTSRKTIVLDIHFGGPHQQFFSLPSAGGTPFKLAVQFNEYWWGLTGTHGYNVGYHGGDPVLVEYNLCTLQANQVIYHKRQRTIEATGNVMIDDGSGQLQHSEYALLGIENGTLTEIKRR